MSLLHLPNEILHQIASYLNPSSLAHLILANHFLSVAITPVLHTRALEPKDSIPALFWAVIHEHEPLITLLLQKGVDVNYKAITPKPQYLKGQTALCLAACLSAPSTTKLLLDAGADPNNAQVNQILHPLRIATEFRRYDTVRLLLEAGADFNLPVTIKLAVSLSDVKMTKMVLSANPGLSGSINHAPFYLACMQYSPDAAKRAEIVEIVKLLVEAGVDVNGRHGDQRRAALHGAVGRSRSVEVVRILLAAGADVSALTTQHETPLHFACGYSKHGITKPSPCPEIIKLLLDAGADVNAKELPTGRTPLHVIVANSRRLPISKDILRILVENGADLNAKDNAGNTVYDLARFRHGKSYMKLLKKLERECHVSSEEKASESWFRRFRSFTRSSKAPFPLVPCPRCSRPDFLRYLVFKIWILSTQSRPPPKINRDFPKRSGIKTTFPLP